MESPFPSQIIIVTQLAPGHFKWPGIVCCPLRFTSLYCSTVFFSNNYIHLFPFIIWRSEIITTKSAFEHDRVPLLHCASTRTKPNIALPPPRTGVSVFSLSANKAERKIKSRRRTELLLSCSLPSTSPAYWDFKVASRGKGSVSTGPGGLRCLSLFKKCLKC